MNNFYIFCIYYKYKINYVLLSDESEVNSLTESQTVPKRGVGRPRGSTKPKKEHKALCLSLDMDTHNRLLDLAEANHMSRVALISYLIWHSDNQPGLSDLAERS